jgi:hypothetical protein
MEFLTGTGHQTVWRARTGVFTAFYVPSFSPTARTAATGGPGRFDVEPAGRRPSSAGIRPPAGGPRRTPGGRRPLSLARPCRDGSACRCRCCPSATGSSGLPGVACITRKVTRHGQERRSQPQDAGRRVLEHRTPYGWPLLSRGGQDRVKGRHGCHGVGLLLVYENVTP